MLLTHPYLLQHGGHPQVRQEGLLQQLEEEVPILDAVHALQEQGHALLVVGNQTCNGWAEFIATYARYHLVNTGEY